MSQCDIYFTIHINYIIQGYNNILYNYTIIYNINQVSNNSVCPHYGTKYA